MSFPETCVWKRGKCGLPRVNIVDYDPQWPLLFQEEKRIVLEATGNKVLAVEHIGSTAVPGLGAKPIIDMMAGVRGAADADQCIALLRRIGYTSFTLEPERERAVGHYYCCGKGPHSIGYHLHLLRFKSREWQRHLLFRDYLRTHPEIAQQYYKLKKELATQYRSDRDGYTEAKTSFIESVIAKG